MPLPEKQTRIRLLDKEFRVNCEPEQAPSLQEAASYLDKQMNLIKQTGRVVSVERIAMMAALNIAHELVVLKKENAQEDVTGIQERLHALHTKIDSAIADHFKPYGKMTSEARAKELSSEKSFT